MATEWTEYHSAFALLCVEKCSDKALLEEAARKIKDNIDAFHEVRVIQVSCTLVWSQNAFHEMERN